MTIRLVSSNVIADMTGWTPDTIRRMARQGRIPARRVGQRYRFNVEEIEQWMAALPKSVTS